MYNCNKHANGSLVVGREESDAKDGDEVRFRDGGCASDLDSLLCIIPLLCIGDGYSAMKKNQS